MLQKIQLILVLCFSLLLPIVVHTQTIPPGQYQGSDMEKQLSAFGGKSGAQLGEPTDPRIIVARLIKTVLGVIGIIAVVLALYAGFLMMTSSGNEEKIAEGKKILMYCAVGVAIILGAYSITYFIYYGIYSSWQNPMEIGNQDTIYMQPNDYDLYNPDPLEQNTTIQ